MQTAKRHTTYNVHSHYNKPQITVSPGEEFIAETELCTGGWLNSIEDIWSPEKTCALNPTVVIEVDGAAPGDMLAVDILDIIPDSIGYTGFIGTSNTLANKIGLYDWGMNLKTVSIKDGFIHWDDELKLPINPMIGTLGTAPREEVLSNARGGPHGGNMDVQEIRAGTTVYLPVEVKGALLHIGDVHALQGDGEINGAGGIECRSAVRLCTRLLKRPEDFRCVRAEDEGYIMTVACGRSMEDTFHLACGQLIKWMAQSYGFSVRHAYLLLAQAMEARCTQFVNPTYSYICKMPKRYLVY